MARNSCIIDTEWTQGAYTTWTVLFKNEDDTPHDMTGYEFSGTVKQYDKGEVLATLEPDHSSMSEGVLVLSLDEESSVVGPEKCVWLVEVTHEGHTWPVWGGRAIAHLFEVPEREQGRMEITLTTDVQVIEVTIGLQGPQGTPGNDGDSADLGVIAGLAIALG